MNSEDKIVTLEKFSNICIYGPKSKKLVMTNGCFDLLHYGHCRYLENCKKQGDILVVALNSDSSIKELKGPTRPIIDEENRAYMLSCLHFVDFIIMFRSKRCVDIINYVRPDIYCKGIDYNIEKLDPDERQALIDKKCEIRFVPPAVLSTTILIERIKNL